MLYIVASYHCMQFQGKLMNQTWENCKKPSFGLDFGPFRQNLGPKKIYLLILHILDVWNCCKLSLYSISRKTNKPNLRKWQKKPSFRPDFGPFGPSSGFQFFFFFFQKSGFVLRLSFFLQKTIYYGHLSSCKTSAKTNDTILKTAI